VPAGPKWAPFFSVGDSKPDLYGPFWLCSTLVLFMAAIGNFASYLEFLPTDQEVEASAGVGESHPVYLARSGGLGV
jgi:hypothetical protein